MQGVKLSVPVAGLGLAGAEEGKLTGGADGVDVGGAAESESFVCLFQSRRRKGVILEGNVVRWRWSCLLYTSPSPRDRG